MTASRKRLNQANSSLQVEVIGNKEVAGVTKKKMVKGKIVTVAISKVHNFTAMQEKLRRLSKAAAELRGQVPEGISLNERGVQIKEQIQKLEEKSALLLKKMKSTTPKVITKFLRAKVVAQEVQGTIYPRTKRANRFNGKTKRTYNTIFELV